MKTIEMQCKIADVDVHRFTTNFTIDVNSGQVSPQGLIHKIGEAIGKELEELKEIISTERIKKEIEMTLFYKVETKFDLFYLPHLSSKRIIITQIIHIKQRTKNFEKKS